MLKIIMYFINIEFKDFWYKGLYKLILKDCKLFVFINIIYIKLFNCGKIKV